MSNKVLAAIGAVVIVSLALVVSPFISFWLAYFGGWIAKITIGPTLASALNILFNTTFVTADKIPMMAGALGWIGGFFKAITSPTRSN